MMPRSAAALFASTSSTTTPVCCGAMPSFARIFSVIGPKTKPRSGRTLRAVSPACDGVGSDLALSAWDFANYNRDGLPSAVAPNNELGDTTDCAPRYLAIEASWREHVPIANLQNDVAVGQTSIGGRAVVLNFCNDSAVTFWDADGRRNVGRHLLDVGTDPRRVSPRPWSSRLRMMNWASFPGMANPRPTELFSLPGFTSAVLTPTTFPFISKTGPPELPGLSAASI